MVSLQTDYGVCARYMVCKGFMKSSRASEHLLRVLKHAAEDQNGANTPGKSSWCAANLTISSAYGICEEQTRRWYARRLRVCCAVPIGVMEADAAFVQHIRAANDLLGAQQLAACEALLDWASSATKSTATESRKHVRRGSGSMRSEMLRTGCRDLDALRRQTLTKWGL